jgi:hypothetical protein
MAALLLVIPLTHSAHASAQTTVDAGAKPWLIIGGLVVFVLFSVFGAVLFRAGSRLARLGDASRQWPTATGHVVSAEVVKKKGYNDGEYEYYAPEIRYAYEVDRQPYTGDTIKFGLTRIHYAREALAREWLERYPAGATPPVRYDPADPKTSALEIGQHTGGRLLFSGSIFLLVAAGAVVFTIYIALLPVE